MDRARLTKLMAMTTSTNDGEALNAMRMANGMIKAEGKTWEDVLTQERHVTVTVTQQRNGIPEDFYQAMEEWQRKKQR